MSEGFKKCGHKPTWWDTCPQCALDKLKDSPSVEYLKFMKNGDTIICAPEKGER